MNCYLPVQCKALLTQVKRFGLGSGELAQQIKLPNLEVQYSRRREPTPASCPLTMTGMFTDVHTYRV